MNTNNSFYDIVQIILFSTAIACMVIAATTFLFGAKNIFQERLFPSLAIIVLLSGWLLRLPKQKNRDKG